MEDIQKSIYYSVSRSITKSTYLLLHKENEITVTKSSKLQLEQKNAYVYKLYDYKFQ